MQPANGAYGDGLARVFRADSSAHLITSALRKSKLAVTRIRRDTPGHGLTSPLPAEAAFSVLLQLRDCPKRELFIAGRSVYRGGYGARTISIVDLAEEPTANLESPFDAMHFYVSRAALKEITDDMGAPRISTLTCERGVFNPTVWHLGQALLPALERPDEVGAMYADHLLLATHTYFAIAFGGMRLSGPSRRGGLAPWQLRCATELMIERVGEDMPLSEPAAACGLSAGYFARAFKQSMGTPPHRWLLLQRVLRAKSLLRDADRSLADIAVACGFADQSHFTRIFTAIVGLSPGAWRRQVQ
jgi:AraC family transcriptional regulator